MKLSDYEKTVLEALRVLLSKNQQTIIYQKIEKILDKKQNKVK